MVFHLLNFISKANIYNHTLINYQVLGVSETFGRADQNQDPIELDHFRSWRTERSGPDKGGGGLCLYYHESLVAHCWVPSVPSEFTYVQNERQWLLFDGTANKFAFLHVYIACQTNQNNNYLQWNEDLFTLLNQETIKLRREGFSVVALGDFNTRVGVIPGLEANHPGVNNNAPMFLNFIKQTNLVIINTLPVSKGLFTRFMGNSGSRGAVLDYGLIDEDHIPNVTSFVIDEEARYAAGSDHALLVASLVFSVKPVIQWNHQEAIRYNFTEKSSFSLYQENLDKFVSEIPLTQFKTMSTSEMLPHLTMSLNESGKKSFGIKIKKIKRGRKLPRPIISAIKAKNTIAIRLSKLLSESPPSPPELITSLTDELTAAKFSIKDMISDHKLRRVHHIRSKILKNDPNRKKFWRFLSTQIKSAGNITGIYDSSRSMVFEQDQIENAILHHFGQMFVGKETPIYPSTVHDDNVQLSITDIDSVLGSRRRDVNPTKFDPQVCRLFSAVELDTTLAAMSNCKASGHDNIPSEFLKNCSKKFRTYLLLFLNKILLDGIVPEELNRGKCILIYKVVF